jgi:hypothetical protein
MQLTQGQLATRLAVVNKRPPHGRVGSERAVANRGEQRRDRLAFRVTSPLGQGKRRLALSCQRRRHRTSLQQLCDDCAVAELRGCVERSHAP